MDLITHHAIEAIVREAGGAQHPQVQVLNLVQVVAAARGKERYKVSLSDGTYMVSAMLGESLNRKVTSGEVQETSIVALQDYFYKPLGNTPYVYRIPHPTLMTDVTSSMVIILSMKVISGPVGEILGNPQRLRLDAMPEPSVTRASPSGAAPALIRPDAPRATTFMPVGALSPYQPRWSIMARVMRPTVRQFRGGEGCLLRMDLLDRAGDTISAIAFNDVAQSLSQLMLDGSVYQVSGAVVRPQNKSFKMGNHAYEIVFSEKSIVTPQEAAGVVEQMPTEAAHAYSPLAEVAAMPANTFLDVIAVVLEVRDVESFSTKSGGTATKREVLVADHTEHSIEMVLWGDQAVSFRMPESTSRAPVLAVRQAKLTEFKGTKSLSVTSSSTLSLAPHDPEVGTLERWFSMTLGHNVTVHLSDRSASLSSKGDYTPSPRLCMAEIAKLRLNPQASSGKLHFSVVCTISNMGRMGEPYYPACPLPHPDYPKMSCNKKVREEGAGRWRCDRCCADVPRPRLRYIIRFLAVDHSGEHWIGAFDEAATQLLGMDAEQFAGLNETGNYVATSRVIDGPLNQKFCIQGVAATKVDLKGDARLNCTAQRIDPIDYGQEAHALVARIGEL